MKEVLLITGGARSGKSSYALKCAVRFEKRGFVATAQPLDDEMKLRIAAHKKKRGTAFITLEEPLLLSQAVLSIAKRVDVVLVDCLTVWLGNLMHAKPVPVEDHPEIIRFLDIVAAPPCNLIMVTNETGMGIVPDNELARRFRDAQGWVNQNIVRRANRAVFMVSGIPLTLKDEYHHGNQKVD